MESGVKSCNMVQKVTFVLRGGTLRFRESALMFSPAPGKSTSLFTQGKEGGRDEQDIRHPHQAGTKTDDAAAIGISRDAAGLHNGRTRRRVERRSSQPQTQIAQTSLNHVFDPISRCLELPFCSSAYNTNGMLPFVFLPLIPCLVPQVLQCNSYIVL